MNIFVNAESYEITSRNLACALVELDYIKPALATALNGAFVARDKRAATPLSEGDRIEVLTPMQGG